MARALRWSFLVVGLLLAAALGAANLLLATAWPMHWLNADPDHLRVTYRSAWTAWPPFALHVRDLELSIQDPATQVELHADRVDGFISPWALRTLRLEGRSLRGSGVVFKLRPRLPSGDPARAFFPDITEFPDGDLVPGEVWPQLITIDLSGLELTDVREVWVGEVRYLGTGSLAGGLVFEPLRALALDGVSLADTGGVVTHRGQPLLTLSTLSARVDLERLTFAGVSPLDFRKVTASVSLRGELEATSIASFAMRSAPGLSLKSAPGPVDVDLHVVRGVLQSPTSFRSMAPVVKLETRFGSLAGRGEVLLSASADERRLELVLEGPDVKGPDEKAWAHATRFRLVSKGPADLAAPDAFDGVLTLSGAQADDLRFLNALMPSSAGVAVRKGHALVNVTLRLDSSTKKGSGEVEATLSKLELSSRGSSLVGDLTLKAHVRSLDLDTGAMRLDGSTLDLTDATVFTDRTRADGFWFKLLMRRWALDGLVMRGDLELELQHLQPVMGLIAAQVPVPFPLRLMSEHHDVSFATEVQTDANHLALSEVRVHAAALDVWADLEVRKGGVWGAALVKSLPVVAAIELRGASTSVVLDDPTTWFHRWRTTQSAKCLSARSAPGPCARSER